MRNILVGTLVLVLAPLAFAGIDLNAGGDVAFYTKLRMEYANKPGYEPNWEILDPRKAVVEAYKAHDFAKTLDLGGKWIDKVPVDAEVYLMMAMAAKEQGDFKAYCEYIEPFYGLLHSITSIGDGKTPETAFRVISVGEEYYLLREIGAKVKKQSLIGLCDKMEIERRNGTTCTLYFDVKISFQAMNRLME